MKPWKPCEHCYLRDKYCENAERELPCVSVQEYLESSSEIKRLQKKLDIATKALRHYEEGTFDSSFASKTLKKLELVEKKQ